MQWLEESKHMPDYAAKHYTSLHNLAEQQM
jgi:hypothetical protein